MAINDITLAGGMRTNLIQLQSITLLQARTTQRLSTGRRVNSAVDDPANYFAAQGHLNRAKDLAARKDAMGEAIQTAKAALQGVDGITSLIQQMKGLASSAKSAGTAERATLAAQFDDLRTQLDALSGDSGYKGTNLLTNGSLTVDFNEDGSSSLTIQGFDATVGGDLAIDAAANDWAADGDIDAAITQLDSSLTELRSQAKALSSNLSIVTTRQDFTTQMINTLSEGADMLTAADLNEEGANLLALQTRQQLGIQALSLASQAQQSILRLF